MPEPNLPSVIKDVVTEKSGSAGTAGLTAVAVFLVWILGYHGVSITAEGAAAITGFLTVIFLVINANGIKGCVEWIWRGNWKR